MPEKAKMSLAGISLHQVRGCRYYLTTMASPLNRESVLRLLREHGETIAGYGVKRIGLFGSFRKGSQTAESDVDLLVEFEPGKKTYSNFIGLTLYLEETLERAVELVTPESLSPYIGPAIVDEAEYVETWG